MPGWSASDSARIFQNVLAKSKAAQISCSCKSEKLAVSNSRGSLERRQSCLITVSAFPIAVYMYTA